MKIGKAGLDIIKSFESCSLIAYPDPGTGGEPWTIGWGHTGGVKKGDTCTQEQADAWLVQDVSHAELAVNLLVHVTPTQNQFDAMVAWVYNVGAHAAKTSTLVRKFNDRNMLGAAYEFKRWNKADGKELDGLTRRRLAEEKLFLQEQL